MNNYLIIGDNQYIRKLEIDKLKKEHLSSAGSDLNYSVHTPDEPDEILDAVQTHTLFGEKRVVIIKEFERMPEKPFEALFSYMEKPLDTTVLVMISAASFKKFKNYKRISKVVEVISADDPGPETVKKWISGFFTKNNIEISREAVDLIVELKGDDTAGIQMELEKLVSFSGGTGIEARHVEGLVGRSVKESIFKLMDAVNRRDAKWVFKIINDLYDQKKQPHEIIGYIGWYLRIMQKILFLKNRDIAEAVMPRELGYSPAYTRRLLAQSAKYPIKKVKKWNSFLINTDIDIKTGKKPAGLALDMLLTAFLSGKTD
jgi:DNA polymerase-3 subunit delta